MAASDEIDGELTEHTLELVRLEVAEVAAAGVVLRDLADALVKKLRQADPPGVRRIVSQQARLNKYLVSVVVDINDAYTVLSRTNLATGADVAQMQGEVLNRAIRKTLGFSPLDTEVKRQAARTLASETLVEGAQVRDWWRRQRGALRTNYADVLRASMARGDSLARMVRTIRHTAGPLNLSARNAETLIRTSIHAYANQARLDLYRQNEEMIKGLQARNPLDHRTSPICIARAGRAWTMDGKAFPGTPESFPGPPPWHFRCRTFLIPIFYPWRTLRRRGASPAVQKELQQASKAAQAKLNGQPAKRLTAESWLKTHSEAKQRDLLGPRRFDLWKAGHIAPKDLIDPTGRPLTVKQLKDRYSPAED